MVDHGMLSWTRRTRKSEGADGSEKVPDQRTRGLLIVEGQHHCKEEPCIAELGHV